jgi:hypothetical protein
MKLSYLPSPHLPPLAWVAVASPETSSVSVTHGCFVETHSHFFVEGAWAGDFESGRIQESDTVFGSGGGLTDGSVTFASCTATTDFLYRSSDDLAPLCVSNSLPLLLAMLGDELHIACQDYARINGSILDGIHQYRADIPTRKGHVTRIMHRNIRWGMDGTTLIEKKPPPEFKRFEDYRDFMQGRIGELFANARHPVRKHPMKIFSTQSRGYDSTAVNALAAPFGIDNIFTSPESKEKKSFYNGRESQTPSDDGTDICMALGLPCTKIDRRSFEKSTLASEEYYWAGLDNNSDLNLHEITSYVSQPTLLLTGQYGEFWYTRDITGEHRMHYFDDSLKKWDLAGHGLSETRLKTGFIQAAIPVIGSRNRAAILRITESPEMQPWRLDTRYDRPIPRRIAEEAGVPREMFGQIKLASIVHLPTPNIPLTTGLRDEFFRHLLKSKLLGRIGIGLLPAVQRFNSWIYFNKPARHFNNRRQHPLLWHVGYGWSKLFGQPLRIPMLWQQLDSYLYAFCVNKVRNECAALLAHSQTAGAPNDTEIISAPISGNTVLDR